MRESAFVDPPWLIDRRGQGYVQVTELLHRIAEVLDGQHTLEQVAEHVSQTTGRSVTADNVRQLISAQFIKKGLVPAADGQLADSGVGRHRSLLQLNMRVRAVEGRTIDPLVRGLSWLFWPPVLVLALAGGVAFECWLYFVHGVAAGIHDALYAPGLLLILFGATIVAAAFHELGHAAALRYAGGMPRGMGAGLYIVYPAFYTDVSDNYRLGRWARVRTDLGGFYFNLVFGLGVFGVYLLTGHEVLLLIVSFLNLEMMRQLMPFLRLDGYWVLADLTGVPDFISHMGGFIRSVAPGRRATDGDAKRQLPPLKRWASLVFVLYIAVILPLMALQVLIMLRGVPRVLATGWDSGTRQAGVIAQAQAAGDGGTILLSILHLVALLLPTLAVTVGIVRLGRRAVLGIWRWSAPSAGRRVAGALISLAALSFLAWAWLPARPAPAAPGAPPRTFSGQASYVPIDANERGSVADMVANSVATTEPRPTTDPTPTNPTPTVLPTLVPTPSSAAAVVDASPTAAVTALPTPAPKPAALVTTSPTPARAVSPVPRTTPTATPLP